MLRSSLLITLTCTVVGCGADVFDFAVSLESRSGIAVGQCSTFALLEGLAEVWGCNAEGQIGVEPNQSFEGQGFNDEPVFLELPWRIADVAQASQHSCLLDVNGRVFCMGSNNEGQLGVGHLDPVAGPVRVAVPVPARAVSAEDDTTVVLGVDGSLWGFGNNDDQQLIADEAPTLTSPTLMHSGPWHAVDVGDHLITCAIRKDDRSLWCRGSGGNVFREEGWRGGREWTEIGDGRAWESLSVFGERGCAIDIDGGWFVWGRDPNPGLPDTPTIELLEPEPGGRFRACDLSRINTCAQREDGVLRCFGENHRGMFGTGEPVDAVYAQPVDAFPGIRFSSVEVGWSFICGESMEGDVVCSGHNFKGTLGNGRNVGSPTPIRPNLTGR